MVHFIDNYDELTVDEVVERLQDRTADEIDAIRSYEEQNKDRVTLLDELEHRDGRDGDEQRSDREETTAGSGSLSEPIPTDSEGDDATTPAAEREDEGDEGDDELAEEGDRPEVAAGDTVTIRYSGVPAYVAGHWFDGGIEERDVTYDRRLATAIETGQLTLVSP